jgi:hypothetical protein
MTVDTDAGAKAAPADHSTATRPFHAFRGREQARSLLLSWKLLWLLAAVGALFRVVLYRANRSLWFDEAALALNLINRPFHRLFSPLDFGQAAPIGFLMLEHSAARSLGYSEYALRLFPLLSGLVALVGFVVLARLYLTPLAAALAVSLFAVAQGPVYYSAELKPYSTDVAAAVLLLLAGIALTEKVRGRWPGLAIGIGGLALLGFSFASAIVLAAVTVGLSIEAIRRRRDSPALLLPLAIWLPGVLAVGAFAATRLESVRNGFKLADDGTIGPAAVFNVHALNVFASGLASSVGLLGTSPWNQLQKVAALVALLGAASLVARTPIRGLMVLLPVPLTLAAAALDQYPLTRRTTLFLVPIVVLALAEGVARLSPLAGRRWGTAAAIGLVVIIGAGPVWQSAKAALQPPRHEELKPVLAYIRDHWRPGDTLYVHYEAQYAFLYYNECGCLSLRRGDKKLWPVAPAPGQRDLLSTAVQPRSRSVLIGLSTNVSKEQLQDLNRLRGRRRVWFVYSHLYGAEPVFVKQHLLRRLDEIGKRLRAFTDTGANAYLYDLDSRRSG